MERGITKRIALVTRADSGIGWHTARRLLDEGAVVVIADRDHSELDEAAARLSAPADEFHAFAADVTEVASLESLHERVAAAVGEIDILVHRAGITGAQAFDELTDEGWVSTIETDLLGAVRVVRAFLGDLRHSRHGRLVLAKGLSHSYAREGLLVNAVSPAFIHTPMTDALMDQRAEQLGLDRDQAIASFVEEKRPFLDLKRRGEPEEVAAVITFLCSEQASFVNGANYRVDGGSVATI